MPKVSTSSRPSVFNNELIRIFLAEVYGTGFMLFVGSGASTQSLLNRGDASSLEPALAWGFGIAFAIYSIVNVSGGHINPSITISLYCLKKISFPRMLWYFLAQTLGAGMGALLSYIMYREAISSFDGGVRTTTGPNSTLGLWGSFPTHPISHIGSFIDQVLGTSILGSFVAQSVRPDCPFPPAAMPLLFGLNAVMLGCAFGYNVGCPLNPARDLGPRLVATMLGYGTEILTHDSYYLLVAITAPLVGACVGVYLFECMVRPAPDKPQPLLAPVIEPLILKDISP